jgi:uncharacterized protein YggE
MIKRQINVMALGQGLLFSLPLALGLVATALPAMAQEEQLMRIITVSGRGTERIPTSLTSVQLGVEAQGQTAVDVQEEVASKSAAVVNLLQSRRVSRLQTTGISLSPMYDYNNNRQRLIGYTATNTVSFQVPTEQAGTLLDDAVQAGATRIDSVSFAASEEAIAQARNTALQEATQDAREQADVVLTSLGLTADEIVNVQISGSPSAPPPIFYRAQAMDAAASAAPTPVIGGEQEVEASVTLQISY